MNLPFILRKYFGGNLHLKRKLVQIKFSTLCLLYLIKVWKEKKAKGKNRKREGKVVENLKRLRVVWLLGFKKRWDDLKKEKKKKKKKALHLLSIATILSSVWAYCRERAMVWILWISLLLFFLPSIFLVCFDFPYPFLS